MDQKRVHEALSLAEEHLVVNGQWERTSQFSSAEWWGQGEEEDMKLREKVRWSRRS